MLNVGLYKFYNNSIVGVKFGIASALSLILANWIAPLDLLSVCFITVLCLQPNLYRSIQSIMQQFYATLIAASITSLVVLIINPTLSQTFSALVIGLSMGLVIVVCININLNESTAIALFTVAYLSTMPFILEVSYWETLHLRFLTIIISIVIAFAINYLSSFVRYTSRFYLLINNLFNISREFFMEFEEYLTEVSFQEVNLDDLQNYKWKLEKIMGTIASLNKELSEIESELKFRKFKVNISSDTIYNYTRIISRIHNVMHYLWNIINTMSFYSITNEYEKEIKFIITSLSLNFRKISKNVINPKKSFLELSEDEQKVRDFIILHKEKIIRKEGNTETNFNLINIFIDLQQIEFNINRLYELIVKQNKNVS